MVAAAIISRLLSAIADRRRKIFQVTIVASFLILTYRIICNQMDNIYGVINSFKGSEDFVFDFFDENFSNNFQILTLNNFTNGHAKTNSYKDSLSLCPEVPPNLKGNLNRPFYLDFVVPESKAIDKANPKLTKGGSFKPVGCQARHRVAIIIPLRGRLEQLHVLLSHMHPIWQKQQMDYTVYVVWQAGNTLFNKAKLMNAGFLEISKDREYDCFVFHDVDMLLENDECLYWCPSHDNPREVSVYINKFDHRYKSYQAHCHPSTFPEEGRVHYFGGVSGVTRKHFYDVNGYSNIYWGWGGEDDDMFMRLWARGYKPQNPHGKKCSFHMIQHKTEDSNVQNEGRFALLTHAVSRMKYEGLNTLRYKLVSVTREAIYTNITLDVGQPTQELMDFMLKTFDSWSERCYRWMPWYFRG